MGVKPVLRSWGNAGGRRAARGAGVVAAVLALAVLPACSGGMKFDSGLPSKGSEVDLGGSGEPGDRPEPTPAPLARVAIQPGPNATGVSPAAPVKVTATGGTLSSVQLTNPQGQPVRGALSADKRTWTSAESLGYSKTYAVAAVAVNGDGKPATVTSRFSTVVPGNFTLPYFTYTNDGGTYGVGQPVVVRFDEPIPDRAAAERTLTVTANPPVQGAWHWTSDREVHWRPPQYWRAGTKVTVSAKVYGAHMGGGLYGQEDRSATFTIGSSKIAVVDDRTHKMTVTIDGKPVRTIPVSMGRGGQATGSSGQTIYFTTMSGPHVVTEKLPHKVMSSASYGLPENAPNGYRTEVDLALRISGSGEFVHSAPWSVADQGLRNVSHGCVNISPQNAQWFYSTFGPGDVVDIRNTGMRLPYTDGLGDWALPWDEWVKGSALQ